MKLVTFTPIKQSQMTLQKSELVTNMGLKTRGGKERKIKRGEAICTHRSRYRRRQRTTPYRKVRAFIAFWRVVVVLLFQRRVWEILVDSSTLPHCLPDAWPLAEFLLNVCNSPTSVGSQSLLDALSRLPSRGAENQGRPACERHHSVTLRAAVPGSCGGRGIC